MMCNQISKLLNRTAQLRRGLKKFIALKLAVKKYFLQFHLFLEGPMIERRRCQGLCCMLPVALFALCICVKNFVSFSIVCWCRTKASGYLWASAVHQSVGDCNWIYHHCYNKHGVMPLLSFCLSVCNFRICWLHHAVVVNRAM
jgi:hypothetical protein